MVTRFRSQTPELSTIAKQPSERGIQRLTFSRPQAGSDFGQSRGAASSSVFKTRQPSSQLYVASSRGGSQHLQRSPDRSFQIGRIGLSSNASRPSTSTTGNREYEELKNRLFQSRNSTTSTSGFLSPTEEKPRIREHLMSRVQEQGKISLSFVSRDRPMSRSVGQGAGDLDDTQIAALEQQLTHYRGLYESANKANVESSTSDISSRVKQLEEQREQLDSQIRAEQDDHVARVKLLQSQIHAVKTQDEAGPRALGTTELGEIRERILKLEALGSQASKILKL